MKVRITGCIPDGYQIVPVTDDEDVFDDFAHLCGFHSHDEALQYAREAGLEVIE